MPHNRKSGENGNSDPTDPDSRPPRPSEVTGWPFAESSRTVPWSRILSALLVRTVSCGGQFSEEVDQTGKP